MSGGPERSPTDGSHLRWTSDEQRGDVFSACQQLQRVGRRREEEGFRRQEVLEVLF